MKTEGGRGAGGGCEVVVVDMVESGEGGEERGGRRREKIRGFYLQVSLFVIEVCYHFLLSLCYRGLKTFDHDLESAIRSAALSPSSA